MHIHDTHTHVYIYIYMYAHIFWGDDDDDISGLRRVGILSASSQPDKTLSRALSHLIPEEKVFLLPLNHPRHPARGLPVVAS